MTGVALIAFLALALAANPTVCATLIIWMFAMRALMIVTSLVSYFVNEGLHARPNTAARRISTSKRR